MEGIQYCGGYLQYCGGHNSSTCGGGGGGSLNSVGDTFSTVEVVQYSGEDDQYCGVYSVHGGITLVQWGTFITVGDDIDR